jgi:small subunit ribosomal protein S1
MLTVGETIECVVLDINQPARRISLGLKQIEPNPWEVIASKYEIGSKIMGKVRNITNFGAFVEIDEGIDGLIHISDMSWTKRINYPSEILKKGEEVEAIILNIDTENQRLSLGLKQLSPDVWEEFIKDHAVGDRVGGTIVRLTKFGAFVDLGEEIEGLVHVSELSDKPVENPEADFKVGDHLQMKITKIDTVERKISLSVREQMKEAEQAEVRSHIKKQDAPQSTHLREAMEEAGIIPRMMRPGAEAESTPVTEVEKQPEQKTPSDAGKDLEETKSEEDTTAGTDTEEPETDETVKKSPFDMMPEEPDEDTAQADPDNDNPEKEA